MTRSRDLHVSRAAQASGYRSPWNDFSGGPFRTPRAPLVFVVLWRRGDAGASITRFRGGTGFGDAGVGSAGPGGRRGAGFARLPGRSGARRVPQRGRLRAADCPPARARSLPGARRTPPGRPAVPDRNEARRAGRVAGRQRPVGGRANLRVAKGELRRHGPGDGAGDGHPDPAPRAPRHGGAGADGRRSQAAAAGGRDQAAARGGRRAAARAAERAIRGGRESELASFRISATVRRLSCRGWRSRSVGPRRSVCAWRPVGSAPVRR